MKIREIISEDFYSKSKYQNELIPVTDEMAKAYPGAKFYTITKKNGATTTGYDVFDKSQFKIGGANLNQATGQWTKTSSVQGSSTYGGLVTNYGDDLPTQQRQMALPSPTTRPALPNNQGSQVPATVPKNQPATVPNNQPATTAQPQSAQSIKDINAAPTKPVANNDDIVDVDYEEVPRPKQTRLGLPNPNSANGQPSTDNTAPGGFKMGDPINIGGQKITTKDPNYEKIAKGILNQPKMTRAKASIDPAQQQKFDQQVAQSQNKFNQQVAATKRGESSTAPNPAQDTNTAWAKQNGHNSINSFYSDIMKRTTSDDPAVRKQADAQQRQYYANVAADRAKTAGK